MFSTRIFKLSALVFFLAACCSSAVVEDKVDLQLTYPNGKSPKVFTAGWTFGAKATLNPGTKGAKDISKQVKWSGSGIFSPAVGAVSHPAFSREGGNTIELSVKVGKKTYKEKFKIQTIEPDNFATVGDKAFCPADAHGCPADPHVVIGPIVSGSAKVLINGKCVARVGDVGVHAACCGPNTFKITSGNPYVLIDGRRAAQMGDTTKHCGGVGKIVESTFTISNQFIGTFSGSADGKATFTIKGGRITGVFQGSHAKEGGGTTKVNLTGTYNPKSGEAKGTMTGTATYVGLDNKTETARVSGTFTGRTKGNTFKGSWKGAATGGISTQKVSGSFSTARAGK